MAESAAQQEAAVPVYSPGEVRDAAAKGAGKGGGGGYQLGWELHPLMEDGSLPTIDGGPKPPHPPAEDMLYGMAQENKAIGNKRFAEGRYEEAIASYSELIMKVRSLENENDVVWDDASRLDVRTLAATAYLNLSACFLKTSQWTHANNTATRALVGDKDPPDPKHDVLPPEKKAKALFRRAQAQSEGFSNLDNALKDLEKASEYAPEDKGIASELRKIRQRAGKAEKAASKKMAGFLNKATDGGEGLFGKEDNPMPAVKTPLGPREPMKLKDGLWMMPEEEGAAGRKKGIPVKDGEGADDPDVVDYDELSREISEMKEDNPEMFEKLRGQVKELVEMQVEEHEKKETAGAAESAEATDEDSRLPEGAAPAEEAAEKPETSSGKQPQEEEGAAAK